MLLDNQDIQSNIEITRLDRNAKQAKYKAKQRQKRLNLVIETKERYKNGIEVKQYGKQPKTPKIVNNPIGFEAYSIKKGGSITALPPQFRAIFKACKQLTDNKYRFKTLCALHGYKVSRTDTRLNVARCLVVLLARSEMTNGRIGVLDYECLTGINTISHHDLMEDYVLRFGEMIDDQTWYTSIRLLREAGYLDIAQIKTNVGSGIIRAAAAYKQLTTQFFKDLKVTFRQNVAKFIMDNYNKGLKKGLNFNWRSYSDLVQDIFDNYQEQNQDLNPDKSPSNNWPQHHQH